MFTRRNLFQLLVIGAGAPAIAGSLNPPAGPIGETGRFGPRIEVNAENTPGDADSVFKIKEPGSYYLGGNLLGEAGKHGIVIATGGVTLDLMGFELSGGAGSLDGVAVDEGGWTNIVVYNGALEFWGEDGVDMTGASSGRIESVRVLASMGAGIRGPALQGVIRACESFGNVDSGIVAGQSTVVSGCASFGNGADGITTGSGCTVMDCTGTSNTEYGIEAGQGSAIHGCAGEFNGFAGVRAGRAGSISNCSARGNSGAGISAAFGCTILNSSAHENTFSGISTSSNCSIISCSAFDNRNSGIGAGSGSVVIGCAASLNDVNGISASVETLIADCSVTENGENGIRVATRCFVTRNYCGFNRNPQGDGAGIFVDFSSSSYCRIDGNHCTGNDRGIDVDGTVNFIVRNTCAANTTNFTIVGGNSALCVGANLGGAINGSAGGASVGSTDPWANFGW